MALKLYDLALADIDARPSPFCWLVKFAMLHKGLAFETIPLRFAEKENYPDVDYGKLPILLDDDLKICDSLNIIAHLEKKYSDTPLTASKGELAAFEFYAAWMGANLFPLLAPMLSVRVHAAVHADDKNYYRGTREARFGMTLEELACTAGLVEKVETVLKTLSAPLARYKYLGGDTPNLSDYNVFSVFMWQRIVCSEKLYETPQTVDAWIERMLDLFDGYARKAVCAA